ncbi:unnamed protein product, partial [Allacma fusca]
MAERAVDVPDNILVPLPGNYIKPRKRTPKPEQWQRNIKKKARLQ